VLEYVFAKSLFGYGERVRGVLIAAFVVILGLAVVYCAGGVVETTAGAESVVRGDFGSALYFSVVTFTTLGYGDLRPAPHLRWAAASEALLGAFLTALFVVVMARKFTR